MTTDRGPILVVGATGRQGGAVARHLLADGWTVRAGTRDVDGAGARALADAGAVPVRVDMDDPATLPAALEGCHGLFSLQNYWEKGVGYDGEVRQGRALMAAAHAAGVAHVVQSSVAPGAGTHAEAPEHFRCKWAIEDAARDLGLPLTCVRTVFFYDNFIDPNGGSMLMPVLAGSLPRDLPFHMIAVDDIGRMVARVFAAPDRYVGASFDLASDVKTLDEMRTILTEATGRPPPGWRMPRWILRLLVGELAKQLVWNRTLGWRFSMDEVRTHLPDPTPFDAWCRANMGAGT